MTATTRDYKGAFIIAAFIYRCPVTGYNVQAFVADNPTKGEEETFQSVTCTIRGRVHLANPKTGGLPEIEG